MIKTIQHYIFVAALAATFFLSGAVFAEQFTIEIVQFKFSPEKIVAIPGDTITWINRDIVPHTATADDNSWDTGEILTNQRKTITIPEKFDRTYYCAYHPTMRGEL
jgi:plastocyanin